MMIEILKIKANVCSNGDPNTHKKVYEFNPPIEGSIINKADLAKYKEEQLNRLCSIDVTYKEVK